MLAPSAGHPAAECSLVRGASALHIVAGSVKRDIGLADIVNIITGGNLICM